MQPLALPVDDKEVFDGSVKEVGLVGVQNARFLPASQSVNLQNRALQFGRHRDLDSLEFFTIEVTVRPSRPDAKGKNYQIDGSTVGRNPGMTKVRVFITSCETGEGAWTTHETKLKQLYELSDKRYALADIPESADIILVGNVREEDGGKKTLSNPLLNKYPNKCFSLSDQDRPLILSRGIYASGTKSLLSIGRVRTGSYTLYYDDWLNPYIVNHTPSQQDYRHKQYLFTFVGRDSHKVRRSLFRQRFTRSDILVHNSSNFDLWAAGGSTKEQMQQRFYDILLASKFSLCPRGTGASSMRLFESMQMGVAPVIISDDWIFPKGPRWDDLSIVIKERDIGDLEKIVQSHEDSFEEMGQLAREAYEKYFAKDVYFDYIVDNCLELDREQLIPESVYWRLRYVVALPAMVRDTLRIKSRVKAMLARRHRR